MLGTYLFFLILHFYFVFMQLKCNSLSSANQIQLEISTTAATQHIAQALVLSNIYYCSSQVPSSQLLDLATSICALYRNLLIIIIIIIIINYP